jgi:hypothetical protein
MEGMCWGIRAAIRSIGMRRRGGRGCDISGEFEMGSRWVPDGVSSDLRWLK